MRDACRSLRRLPRLVVGTPRWADRSTAAEVPPSDRAGSGRSATWCCAAADAGESSDGSFRCLTEKIWYPAHRPHESGTPARCARSTCRPSDPLHPQSFDGGDRAHIVRKDNREQFGGSSRITRPPTTSPSASRCVAQRPRGDGRFGCASARVPELDPERTGGGQRFPGPARVRQAGWRPPR